VSQAAVTDAGPAERSPPPTALPVTSRTVLALAIPVMISNATTPLVGLVDTAVVGQLGQAHLMGGVAVASTIFNLIYGTCYFLQLGTAGFTAQAVGAKEPDEIAANLFRPLLIALALGLVIALFRSPIAHAAVWLVGGSPAVQATAVSYIEVRALSAPAVLAQMALLGWLIGLGRTHVVFVLQLTLNLINIGLTILFVISFGWGVTGAAAGTAIADYVASAMGLGYGLALLRARGWSASTATVLDSARLVKSFATNRDITIRTLCIAGVFSFFFAQGARAGDLVLAANAALYQLAMLTVYLIDGFETAVMTMVGQAVGARDLGRFRSAVRLTFLWAGITGVVLALILWFAGPSLVALLTTSLDVRETAGRYLVWAALIPIIGLWAFMFDGIFVGATRGQDLRNMMLISTAAYGVAVVALTSLMGNHGLWMALLVFFVVRALTLWTRMLALERDIGGPATAVSGVAASSSAPAR
jgi:MATE family multidrug resistance protein